ncbi:MAG TPA: MaoC family dehydratase [Alphaproteobacteria bacterium]|nr:MaoC family dehydratase [Alphaproteobacteria bacterium]
MSKAERGRFFEDFALGVTIEHATPRTLTEGDAALYQALYGSRFALQSSTPFAQKLGLKAAPLDDLLVFHTVFGKSVPDISLNAVANLGYAEGKVFTPVFPSDTLTAKSEVIGLRENSNRKSGIVYVRTGGYNQRGHLVLGYTRWVMVNKRDEKSPAPPETVPALAKSLAAEKLTPPETRFASYDFKLAGSARRWSDYAVGEKLDHGDGQTIEEAEHQLATRLYQNTAKVHFNAHAQAPSRFGKRLVYGGHIISIARALSFNGLENAVNLVALNAGTHVAPSFAGDTIYAWTEVLDRGEARRDRPDLGYLRLRSIALKNEAGAAFPYRDAAGVYHPSVVLDLDYWVAMPR